MHLSKLKREVEDLGNFEKKISLFSKHWIKPKQYNFLGRSDKEQLKAFKKVVRELKYGQVVNEKIISLANHLVRLQIAQFNKDKGEASKIVNKFLSDNQINIKKVIDEVNYIEFQLKLFKDFYERIIYRISKQLDLEGNIVLVDGDHHDYLKEMVELNKKQKNYLKEIGEKFVDFGKKL